MSPVRSYPSARRAALAALAGLLVFGALLAPAPSSAQSAPPFRAIPPVEKKLPNGLRVLAIPDSRSDLVHVSLRVPAGVAAEPPSQPGIAGVTVQLLRTGTTLRNAERFAGDVDRLGGSFAATAGREYASVAMTVLARDAEDAFSVVSDAVQNAFFAEADVRRGSTVALSRLVQAHGDAATTADEQAWAQALPGHPAARSPLGAVAPLRALSRDQVRSFYSDRYRPDRATLVVAGNLPAGRAFELAEEWFGRWSGRAADALPVAAPPAKARVVIFDRPDLPACELRLAVPVPGRRAPDRLARAFGAELLERRLELGGAKVRASLQLLGDQGLWIAGASAPADSAAAVAGRLRRTLEDAVAQPPAASAVREGGRILRARFPLGFETLAGAASQWQLADLDGEPRDAFDTFASRVAALGPAEIQAALKRELDFERATLVAVGEAAVLGPKLERFGPVVVIPMRDALELSEPARAIAEASTEEVQKGRGILALALDVHGGADRLRGIKDSIVDQDATIELQGETTSGHLRYVRKEPFRLKLETTIDRQVTRQVLSDRQAWSLFPGDSVLRVADSTEVNDLRAAFLSDPIHLLLEASTPVTRVAWRGRETIDGREADRVDTAQPDDIVKRFYFDVKTRRLLAVDVVEPILQIVAPARWLYRDWREVQGVSWPFEERRLISGQPYMTLRTVSIQINPGVKDAEFVAPSSMRFGR